MLAAIVILHGTMPGPVGAQCSITECGERGTTSEYVASFGFNVLFGGVTSGLFQLSRGGSFLDGFSKGSLGGSLVFAGKAVAGRSFTASGLTGRQLAGIGNSIWPLLKYQKDGQAAS